MGVTVPLILEFRKDLINAFCFLLATPLVGIAHSGHFLRLPFLLVLLLRSV